MLVSMAPPPTPRSLLRPSAAPPLRSAAPLAALCAVIAGIAAGSATLLPALPSGPPMPAPVVAASTPSATRSPEPWFQMRVATAQIGFAAPPVMPTGAPPMRAAAGILVDIDSGAILWAKNPDKSLPPASLTKVLTALVALENFDPAEAVTITRDALGQSWDDTVMGLKAGQVLSVQELLEGMLLPSGDDAASAIAVDTVGLPRFLAAMNAQVAALGLQGAQFTNTSGLDDPGLYVSPYDLAVIATYVYENFPLFDRIVATRSMVLPATPQHPAFFLRNLDALLADYPAAVGIKPGWTGNAGACLIGMAVRNGHRLLAVLMNAAYPAQEEARLLDWGFSTEGLRPLLPPTPRPKPSPTPAAHRS
jgi:D-alanyl-D-alanine carboxypeptidase (penicillin-binding protein 5/6)